MNAAVNRPGLRTMLYVDDEPDIREIVQLRSASSTA